MVIMILTSPMSSMVLCARQATNSTRVATVVSQVRVEILYSAGYGLAMLSIN